jgi:hypothetical protein
VVERGLANRGTFFILRPLHPEGARHAEMHDEGGRIVEFGEEVLGAAP